MKNALRKLSESSLTKDIRFSSLMAPEVILRKGYGKPIDWWAMGIILYEFLVGATPFFGQSIGEIFFHVVKTEVVWPQGEDTLPVDAQDLISLLLKKNCVTRLGTRGAGEVKAHPFFQGLDWNNLLSQKPLFVPQLENDEDTCYFQNLPDESSKSSDAHESSDEDESSHNDDSSDDDSSSSDDDSSCSDTDSSSDNNESSSDDNSSSDDESTSDDDESSSGDESSGDDVSSGDDESSDEDEDPHEDESPVDLPYFCSVAFRFSKVYGSPEHLSSSTMLEHSLLSTKPKHKQREQQSEEEVDEGYEEQDSKDLCDEDMRIL